jgi:hypothetical protein
MKSLPFAFASISLEVLLSIASMLKTGAQNGGSKRGLKTGAQNGHTFVSEVGADTKPYSVTSPMPDLRPMRSQ